MPLIRTLRSDGATRRLVVDALQESSTLVPLTLFGLAVIFATVLAPVSAGGATANLALVLSGLAAAVSFAVHFARARAALRAAIEFDRRTVQAAARSERLALERAEKHAHLERSFIHLGAADGKEGVRVLRALNDEFQELAGLLHSNRPEQHGLTVYALLPDLAEETYRAGIGAVSDALELLLTVHGTRHERIESDLRVIVTRLEGDRYEDDRDRTRDMERKAWRSELLARHHETRQRAGDLLYEAERCTAALSAARLELAAVRFGGDKGNGRDVARALQDAITCVHEVQDELRRIGE